MNAVLHYIISLRRDLFFYAIIPEPLYEISTLPYMLMPKYDRSSITPENPTHLCRGWIPPSQHPDQNSWCLGWFCQIFSLFVVCTVVCMTFSMLGKRDTESKNMTFSDTITPKCLRLYRREIMAIHDNQGSRTLARHIWEGVRCRVQVWWFWPGCGCLYHGLGCHPDERWNNSKLKW